MRRGEGGEVGARAQEGVNGENGEENLVLSRLPGKKEKRDAKLALLLFLAFYILRFNQFLHILIDIMQYSECSLGSPEDLRLGMERVQLTVN